MTKAEKRSLKTKITKAFRKSLRARKIDVENLIPGSFTAGKIYEAFVLAKICERLKVDEHCSLILVGSTKPHLKSSPGPINPHYPHIEVFRNGTHIGDIWTDIEFTSLSFSNSPTALPTLGEYHELDIALVSPNCSGRPGHDKLLIAAECKNTGYQKNLLREILGVRRELSFLSKPQPTMFANWPQRMIPAKPPCCLLVFSTDSNVLNYIAPGQFFGIRFFHEPI